MVLKILSLNVKGLRNDVKRRAIFNYCRKRADIICLQETHATAENEVFWQHEWRGKTIYSNGDSNARGVCIMFKAENDYNISEIRRDNTGRTITSKRMEIYLH